MAKGWSAGVAKLRGKVRSYDCACIRESAPRCGAGHRCWHFVPTWRAKKCTICNNTGFVVPPKMPAGTLAQERR